MRGKFTTKTIIIAVIALLVLAAAVTATVVFLKDSGEAAAAQEQDLLDAIQPNEDSQERSDDTTKDGENLPELGDEEERTNQLNTGNANTNNDTLEEPAPSTVEREKVVSETTTLGWNNIGLNSKIGANELEIVYNNLEYKVEYYFDEILTEDLSVTISENSKGKIIDTYEDKVKVGYKLDKVEKFPLTITVNEESNVIKVFYIKDEEQVKDISYTVKYFIEDEEQESDRKVTTETVWINAEETMTFDSSLLNKEYVGYKKVGTDPEVVGETVNNGDVIEVYYEKDEEQVKDISYTVKYFIEDEEQESDRKVITETVWVNSEETMTFDSSLLNKEYVGYKKVGTDPESIGETVNNGDVIEVYYEKDEEQVKDISYTVKYLIEDEEQESDRKVTTETVWVNAEETMTFDSNLLNKEYVGYKKVGTNPEVVGETVNNGDVIEVYYEKDEEQVKDISYTVKYFIEDEEQESDRKVITETVWVNSEETMTFDSSLLNKEYVGYKKVGTDPESIGETVNNGDVIEVYYEKDEEQVKDISYTVKYFIEDEEQESDRKVTTETVWINAEEKMTFDSSLLNKEYVGYKKVGTDPESIGETVNNGDVIEVYYEKDEEQVKDISYTVKYFIEDEEQESDRKVTTETVWINAEEKMTFDSSLLNKEYVGYKKVGTDPEVVGETVNNGDIIEVYYEKDEEQVKDISYTVKYFIEDEEQESDRKVITETVWINAEETMTFDSSLLNKEYVGYKKVGTDPEVVGETVNNGDIIEVYYEKDEEQVKDISYTVKYFIEDEEQESDRKVITETVWVNAEETMTFDSSLLNKEYVGYKKVGTDPESIGETVNNGDVIKVYYEKDEEQVKDISYTVKYFIEDEEQESDRKVITETVWINAEETMAFDSSLLNKEYVGYKKVSTNPETVGSTVNNGDVIELYYERENFEYTVKYYKDSITESNYLDKVEGISLFEETITADTTKFIPTGYEFVGTAPSMVIKADASENIINVVYTKASYKYVINYYKDSINTNNLLGRIPGEAEYGSKITADITKNLPETGYMFKGEAPSIVIEVDASKNVINVVYSKVTNLSYTINYLEKGTNKVLKTETISDQEYNKEIKIVDLEIPETITSGGKEYKYSNKYDPNTGRILIGTDLSKNVINLYYERPEIKSEKTSSVVTNATIAGKAYAGDEITYTIKVWNIGSGDKEVKVEDSIPAGTTYKPESASSRSGKATVSNGKVTWIVNVPANTSEANAKVLTFKVTINDNTTGVIKNTANIDGKKGPNDGDGVGIIKPANITVSKVSSVVDKSNAAEKGDKLKYTITAKNTGDDVGTVIIKDTDLKTLIDSGVIEFIEKTGYTGSNEDLIAALAGNGVSLTVQGNSEVKVTYTVKVLAKVGTTIKNKVEVVSGGKVDEEKEETINVVEKTATITENTETIKGKNIVIVIDLSASMNDIIGGVSKLEAAKDAAQGFITKIFEKDPNGTSGTKLSLVTFNYGGNEKSSGDTDTKYVGTKVFTYGNNSTIVTNKSQAAAMNSAIEAIELDSDLGTNMGAALIKAEQQLGVLRQGNTNDQVIIFLGDGDPSTGGNENTETAINNKATSLKNAGVEIYTIGFGLHQEVDVWCPAIVNSNCDKEHYKTSGAWDILSIFRYHKEAVNEEDAIRILRNMASGTTSAEKDKYARSSTGAQSLIDTFNSISSSIAIDTDTTQSSNAKIELADTIYADDTHPITIKVNGVVDTTLKSLPTDATGKVIKEGTKYYLDLTKFDADVEVSITYFSK